MMEVCYEYNWRDVPLMNEKLADLQELNDHNDLNIIGFYRLTRMPKIEPKLAPWASFKNVERCNHILESFKDNKDIKDIVENEDRTQRDKGFSILSKRKNVVTYLKKTKFCRLLIEQGKCNREICNFAHTVNEISFPYCVFADDCKKDGCKFRHPNETIDDYKIRVQFSVPSNIL